MPAPRMPERCDHRQTHKDSDAKHDDHVATESARIFDYFLHLAHKSTGVRLFDVYETILTFSRHAITSAPLLASPGPRFQHSQVVPQSRGRRGAQWTRELQRARAREW